MKKKKYASDCSRFCYRSLAFLKYFLFSRNRKGYGIHSPFLFEFITAVLRDKQEYDAYRKIESVRNELGKSKETIRFHDYGTGAIKRRYGERKISEIIKTSATRRKYGKLLFRTVRYFNPLKIIELGTSLGIGTMYMGMGNPGSEIITLEGCEECARRAQMSFRKMGLENIVIKTGPFKNVLPEVLKRLEFVDLVFFDGDHRRNELIDYFETCLPYRHNNTVFILDDIHWSAEMKEAWGIIKQYPEVNVTVDLYQMGIIFFRTELSRQDFSIKF